MKDACGLCGKEFDTEDLDDGICNPCFEELMHRQACELTLGESSHTITHEMAMDAGDMSLEGQEVKW